MLQFVERRPFNVGKEASVVARLQLAVCGWMVRNGTGRGRVEEEIVGVVRGCCREKEE